VVGGAQHPEDPADPERVGDRLPQAEARRKLEVDQRRRVAADLDHVQDVVGTVDRGAAVEVRGDRRRRAPHARDVARHRRRRLEAVGVDVVQRDLDAVELGVREDVAEQVLREDDAPGADECDLRRAHPLFAPSVSPLMNCRCSST
jgi:hypothetical protein